jgi:hypothetical protein
MLEAGKPSKWNAGKNHVGEDGGDATSTAVETGQNIQQLEQKLQDPNKLRFRHFKLAA